MLYLTAICDDNAADLNDLSNLLSLWAADRGITVTIDRFPSAESFLFHYVEVKNYDLLLLDIEMGAMDGVTMAKRIRKDDESVQIVFITGYSDYIAEGYDVAALHYLMKPVNRDKLFSVLDRALENQKQNSW